MHLAPPVNVVAQKSRWQFGLIIALMFAACLVQIALFARTWQMDSSNALVLTSTVVATAWALMNWKLSPKATLRWDGENWFLEANECEPLAELLVAMDWHQCLLLRAIDRNHRITWLWLDRSSSRQQWTALRRAVWSSQRLRVATQPQN